MSNHDQQLGAGAFVTRLVVKLWSHKELTGLVLALLSALD
jgi:hypothetical protein